MKTTPSSRRKSHRKNGSARTAAFDALEPRILMAASDYAFLTGSQLTIRGGDATSADIITLAKSGTNLSVTIDVSSDFLGGGNLAPFTSTFAASSVTSILIQSGGAVDTININGLFASMPATIDSGDGADAINIGGANLDNVASNITLSDAIAGDAVTIDDTAGTVARNVTVTSTTLTGLGLGVLTYNPAALATLTVNGGARGNTFDVTNAGAAGSALITTLNTGNGVDNVFVHATLGRLNVYGGNGMDNVRIGDAGSLAGIQGVIYVNNINSRSALIVDDFANTTSKEWSFHGSAIDLAPAAINYVGSSTRTLEINAGSGDDVLSIFGSAALTTTVNAAGGNKTINFFNGGSPTGLTRPLTIANSSGQSSISIDASGDTVSRSLTISSTGITGIAAGSINFDPADISSLSLVGGNAGNTYDILSTIPGKTLTIFGGSGSDTAIVRGPYLSTVVFNGGPNFTGAGDSMQIVGSGTESAVYTPSTVSFGDGAVNVGGQTILFTGLEPLTMSNLASATLVTPNGNDAITIDSPAAGRNRISGTSGGIGFESLTVFGTPTLILDLARNDGTTGDDSVTVSSAGMVASGLTTFSLNAGGGNNTFTIQGGTAKLDPTLGTIGGANLQVNASGTALLTLAANQRLAGLNVSGTAKVNVTAGGSYLRLGSLSIASGASVDLFDNDLIIQSTSAAKAGLLNTINGYLRTGRNGGAWNGAGLRSGTAAALAARTTGLAGIVNDRGNGAVVISSLDLQPVDVNTILVKYTCNGDSDLNGTLNADDFARIDSGFINRPNSKGYYNGDFDYSGTIDADDYFLIDRAASGGGAPLSAAAPAATEVKRRPRHHRKPSKHATPVVKPEALARWFRDF